MISEKGSFVSGCVETVQRYFCCEENVEQVKTIINSEGLEQSLEFLWSSYVLDIRSNLAEFLNRPDLSTSHTSVFYRPVQGITMRAFVRGIFRFHSFSLAAINWSCYFANTRNRTKTKDFPLVIEFLAPVQDVFVDGKDFLYSAFKDGPRRGMRDKILRCFGVEISEYLDRAWNSKKYSIE